LQKRVTKVALFFYEQISKPIKKANYYLAIFTGSKPINVQESYFEAINFYKYLSGLRLEFLM
jgi:hypothetical protein